jgi:signal transduction histidine kinase/HPt (histidine-containing phosphotransfer) domain-containing protein
MLSERRTRSLRDLAIRAGWARSVAEATALSLKVLAGYELDLPFLLLYLSDQGGSCARLVGHIGLGPGHALSPPVIDLADADTDSLVPGVLRNGETTHLTDLIARFGAVNAGPYPEPIQQALLLPIALPGVERPVGVLVAGVSTRLTLDETYLGFLDLVGAGVSSAVANATAYEQQRQRAEALAEIDAAKTAFFSNVSHEFRTPLTLMLGPLEDELADAQSLEPLRRERLETAYRNSLRLLRLVNSILDFSRVESGRMHAAYIPTDLAAYTTDLTGLFRSATEKAGLRLVVDCEPLPELLLVDREMWEKIVLNLLSNAFKHTFSGTISVTLIWGADCAELSVADTGVGIAAGELPKLFERFHRVKGARSRTPEGTGIGLSLVQELARLHGGEVRIESEEGRGSKFTVTVRAGHAHLPEDQVRHAPDHTGRSGLAVTYADEALRWLTPEELPAASDGDLATPEQVQNGGSARARVLLADDNADMRSHVRRLLEHRFEITAVSDGAAALNAALTRPPDLVLTDVMMPHLDGFELLAALRADDRTRTIPVIMLSARAGEEAALEGIGAGADDYLVKPFSARELIARVSGSLALAKLRREAAEQLEIANRQLVAATNAKSEFLSRMSHELRTPLNAILGFGQLLEMGTSEPDQQERVAQILKAGAHLLELINEVLDISAVESGRMRISIEPVLVSQVLSEAIEMIRPLADANSISVPKTQPDGSDSYVLADRHRLKQVLLNLLANAVKYNVRGGRVWVRCDAVGESRLRIVIADGGIGIAEHDLERLFVPFERLAADPTAVEGTGLGLALTKGLVEAMGGQITATSAVGNGSTFTVELAAVDAPPEAQPSVSGESTAQPRAERHSRTILYVEDNPSNVKLVEHVLSLRPEITLIVAMQGSLGVDLAREHDPSLILLDLNLPDLPGEEVLRRLKAEPQTTDTPVVVISADATAGQLERLRASGAAGYLSKPFDVTRLLAIVDESALSVEAANTYRAGKTDRRTGQQPARSVITALRENGLPAEQLDAMVAGFLLRSAESLARLAQAVDNGDLDTIRNESHDLHGTSASFGATILGDIARQLQAAAKSSSLPDARELIDPLARAFDDARATLLADYPGAGAPRNTMAPGITPE